VRGCVWWYLGGIRVVSGCLGMFWAVFGNSAGGGNPSGTQQFWTLPRAGEQHRQWVVVNKTGI